MQPAENRPSPGQAVSKYFYPNASNNGKDYNEIPESDQLEIKAIAQELGEVLQKLKEEGEAI